MTIFSGANTMQNVLLTLWPLFMLIALGAILRRNKAFEPLHFG